MVGLQNEKEERKKFLKTKELAQNLTTLGLQIPDPLQGSCIS